jgi:hypothetical protein
LGDHQTGEGEEMESSKSSSESFVIASQAAEARRPGKTALDHPAARQQHKAALGSHQPSDPGPSLQPTLVGLEAKLISRGTDFFISVSSSLQGSARQVTDLGYEIPVAICNLPQAPLALI